MSRSAITSRQTLNFSQNYLVRSAEFDNASWTNGGLQAVTANAIANPVDGAVTADLLTEDSSAATFHRVYQLGGITPLKEWTPYTASFFFKNNTRRYCGILMDTGSNNSVFLDLQTGTITSSGKDTTRISSITTHLEAWSDSWYRLGLTILPLTNIASGTAPQAVLSDDGVDGFYNGDGTSSLYVFGGQFVQSNWMGIYTPTTASNSTNPIRNRRF